MRDVHVRGIDFSNLRSIHKLGRSQSFVEKRIPKECQSCATYVYHPKEQYKNRWYTSCTCLTFFECTSEPTENVFHGRIPVRLVPTHSSANLAFYENRFRTKSRLISILDHQVSLFDNLIRLM